MQKSLGISQKTAGKLCLSANRLLSVSLATLEGRINWLQARFNTSEVKLRKTIERRPEVLTFSIEGNVEPSLENIQSGLELSDKELTKMIVNQPDTLLHNFSSFEKLAARLSFLRDFLSIEEGDIAKLRKVISKRPEILYWPEESMLESQQWINGGIKTRCLVLKN